MFEFTQYTVEVLGEPPATGYSDDWIVAIYNALTDEQQRAVRLAIRKKAAQRRTGVPLLETTKP